MYQFWNYDRIKWIYTGTRITFAQHDIFICRKIPWPPVILHIQDIIPVLRYASRVMKELQRNKIIPENLYNSKEVLEVHRINRTSEKY